MLMVRKHNNAPAVCFARGPREDVVAIAARFGTRVQRAMSSARGWWLVEADSIDAARKVIEHFERDPDATCVHGRVLAHGGKR